MRVIMTHDKRFVLSESTAFLGGLTLLEGALTIVGDLIKVGDKEVAKVENNNVLLNSNVVCERFGNTNPLKSGLMFMFNKGEKTWPHKRR